MLAHSSVAAGSRIRYLEAEDLPQVADLHRRTFQTGVTSSEESIGAHRRYFEETFLRSPVSDGSVRSLVYCEGRKVTGFLGAVSRPMMWKGERIEAGISSQFIVDQGSRGLAGVELARMFLNGPQDVSIADESNLDSRRLWEALGGGTSLLHSMQWVCPLRPSRFALWAAGKKSRLGLLARAAGPAAGALDGIASRLRLNPFRSERPSVEGHEIDAQALLALIDEFAPARSLHSTYSPELLEWLLADSGHRRRQPALRKVLVRSPNRRVCGWYVYRPAPEGLSEVVQLFAAKGCAADVLSHLAFHAAKHGAAALRGRSEPGLAEALSEAHWPCHWGPWMLVHSHRPGLAAAFQSGDVFFSRLDGEWRLRFD
jgi:hypothetical protein